MYFTLNLMDLNETVKSENMNIEYNYSNWKIN